MIRRVVFGEESFSCRQKRGAVSYTHLDVYKRQGQKTIIAPVEHREKYALKWDKVNYLQEPGLELVLSLIHILRQPTHHDSHGVTTPHQWDETQHIGYLG